MSEEKKKEEIENMVTLNDYEFCVECKDKRRLRRHKVEILNMLYEVGAFCENDKCPRYKLLVP
jgi:hypothetical protein